MTSDAGGRLVIITSHTVAESFSSSCYECSYYSLTVRVLLVERTYIIHHYTYVRCFPVSTMQYSTVLYSNSTLCCLIIHSPCTTQRQRAVDAFIAVRSFSSSSSLFSHKVTLYSQSEKKPKKNRLQTG